MTLNNVEKIDVHNHIYPRSYIKYLRSRDTIPKINAEDGVDKFYIFPDNITKDGRPLDPLFYDIEEKINQMDKHGIDKTILSLGNPWVDCFSSEKSVEVSEKMNDEIHDLVSQYPERLIGMGVLPLKDPEAAVKELDRVVKDLDFKGVVVGSNIDGAPLDDESLSIFYERADQLGARIYIHPRNPFGIGFQSGYEYTIPLSLGFPFDTTLALSRLILSGILDDYSDIEFIGAHAGGALPYLMGRLDRGTPFEKFGLEKKPSEYIKEDIYYDTLIYSTDHLEFCSKLFGSDRILLATDDPFPITDVGEMIDSVKSMDVSDQAKEMIFSENAKKLFNI